MANPEHVEILKRGVFDWNNWREANPAHRRQLVWLTLTTADLSPAELHKTITELEKQMKQAAQTLEFEKAAVLRNQITELRQVQVLKEAGADPDMPTWEQMQKLDATGVAYDV